MRRLMVWALLCAGATSAWAECTSGMVYKQVGTLSDGAPTERLVDGPISIDAVGWQCGDAACNYALYDGDASQGDEGEVETSDVKIENGGVAGEGSFDPLTAPLTFLDGVTVWGNGLAGISVFQCQPRN